MGTDGAVNGCACGGSWGKLWCHAVIPYSLHITHLFSVVPFSLKGNPLSGELLHRQPVSLASWLMAFFFLEGHPCDSAINHMVHVVLLIPSERGSPFPLHLVQRALEGRQVADLPHLKQTHSQERPVGCTGPRGRWVNSSLKLLKSCEANFVFFSFIFKSVVVSIGVGR